MMNIIMMSELSDPLAELEESDIRELLSEESLEPEESRLVSASNSELPDVLLEDCEDWLELDEPSACNKDHVLADEEATLPEDMGQLLK
jgi:hypothetical protein